MPPGKEGVGSTLHCSDILWRGKRIGLLISAAKETVLCRELCDLGNALSKVCAVPEQDRGLIYVVFRSLIGHYLMILMAGSLLSRSGMEYQTLLGTFSCPLSRAIEFLLFLAG